MLVSTSEAANILGISLQGVHYRIKKNLLKSKKENGKILVYIDKQDNQINTIQNFNFEDIIKAKDEQIELLKENMDLMKEQYINEINRLEKNQDIIIDVFKSEITLLQQAYNEMKNLKLENKSNKNEVSLEKIEFFSVKEFFSYMKKYNLKDIEIKNLILKQIKKK